jgi:DNA repair exonuclease SbcCD nuclease subunit
MRIVHVSDTHLGYQAYRAIDKESGLNQREVDVNKAFEQAVSKAIEIKPDAVLHTGDLFDSVRPSNRTLHFATQQLLRLSSAGIPVVIISGNHSLPRMRDTGHIFQLFTLPAFPNLYPVFKSRYEKIVINGMAVHAIPQCLTKEDFDEQLKQIKLDKSAKYNILILHAAIAGIPEFSMGEFNEQEVAESYLKPEFDYIGLGHYHKYTQLAENAFYVGSTERFSFNEVGQEKGFMEIDLNSGKATFHRLKIRAMIELPSINAQGKDAESTMKEIVNVLNRDSIGKNRIVRLTIENIASSTQNALDFNLLRRLTANTLHFELRFNREEKNESVASATASIGRLRREFRDYLAQIAIEKNRAEILKLGLGYLERVSEQD